MSLVLGFFCGISCVMEERKTECFFTNAYEIVRLLSCAQCQPPPPLLPENPPPPLSGTPTAQPIVAEPTPRPVDPPVNPDDIPKTEAPVLPPELITTPAPQILPTPSPIQPGMTRAPLPTPFLVREGWRGPATYLQFFFVLSIERARCLLSFFLAFFGIFWHFLAFFGIFLAVCGKMKRRGCCASWSQQER